LARPSSSRANRRTFLANGDEVAVAGVQALAVAGPAALTLVRRSDITFDFIYFQF
jgi:hypothetical protein